MQNLELEITTAMYTEHDRHDDKLETQNVVRIMTTMASMTYMLYPGIGEIKNRTKQADLTL